MCVVYRWSASGCRVASGDSVGQRYIEPHHTSHSIRITREYERLELLDSRPEVWARCGPINTHFIIHKKSIITLESLD